MMFTRNPVKSWNLNEMKREIENERELNESDLITQRDILNLYKLLIYFLSIQIKNLQLVGFGRFESKLRQISA